MFAGKAPAEAAKLGAQKLHVEWRVVGDEDAAADKLLELREDLVGRRLAGEHIARYAVCPLRSDGYARSGVYQSMKFLDNDPTLKRDGSDFNHPVASQGQKSGRFNIDRDYPLSSIHEIL